MTIAGGSSSFAGSSRLVSERIASTSASCHVTFGLYRNLDRDGTLALYIEDDSFLTTKLWTDSRTILGLTWTPIIVSIGRRRDGFRLVFISTHVGSTIQSDISIDDFTFQNCNVNQTSSCQNITNSHHCSNDNCIPPDNVNRN